MLEAAWHREHVAIRGVDVGAKILGLDPLLVVAAARQRAEIEGAPIARRGGGGPEVARVASEPVEARLPRFGRGARGIAMVVWRRRGRSGGAGAAEVRERARAITGPGLAREQVREIGPGAERESMPGEDRARPRPPERAEIAQEPELHRLGLHRSHALEHGSPGRAAGRELAADAAERRERDPEHDVVEVLAPAERGAGHVAPRGPEGLEIDAPGHELRALDELLVQRRRGPAREPLDVDQRPIGPLFGGRLDPEAHRLDCVGRRSRFAREGRHLCEGAHERTLPTIREGARRKSWLARRRGSRGSRGYRSVVDRPPAPGSAIDSADLLVGTVVITTR